jgi:hypothetical protein
MTERVTLKSLVGGFEQAAQRFYVASKGTDSDVAFRPLFEALNWSVSVDERLQEVWEAGRTNPAKWWSDGFIHGDDVKGVRYARNRVHHQWADALFSSSGFAFPMTFPLVFLEWRWRITLPPGRNNEFLAEYDAHLAGAPARVTLGNLSLCFHDAAVELRNDAVSKPA